MRTERYENRLEAVLEDLNSYLYAHDLPELTLGRLAKEVGVSRQAITSIARGEAMPRYSIAANIFLTIKRHIPKGKEDQFKFELFELFPVPEPIKGGRLEQTNSI